MAFIVILRKTLVDLTGYKGNLALLIIGVGISFLSSLAFRFGHDLDLSAEMQMIDLMGAFLYTTFTWSAGFFLAITVSVKAAGLIADESSEGTLTLLVSRPINRWQILAGKFVALVIYSILLDLLVLLLFALILTLVNPVTGDTLMVLLSAIFRLIPYILLVTVIFGSISIALSTITSRRIAITAIMCGIVAGVFYFVPMMTSVATINDSDGVNNFAYFNLSGHLGNIFITIVQSIDGGHFIEGLENMRLFTIGIRPYPESLTMTGYSDLAFDHYTRYPFEFVSSLGTVASLGIWLCVTALCLFAAFRTLERKQVT